MTMPTTERPEGAPPAPLEEGDCIWYRRKGETFVHSNWVRTIRERTLEVRIDPPNNYAFRTDRGGIWLDRQEIEIIDREAYDGRIYP